MTTANRKPGDPVRIDDCKTHSVVYVADLADTRYLYKDAAGWYYLHATSARIYPLVNEDGTLQGVVWGDNNA